MIYWILGMQLMAAHAVRWVFHRRAYRWTLRHSLLCTVVPLFLFVFWTALWWWNILPSNSLPTTWLDERPSFGEMTFLCGPPLAISWLLFFVSRGSLRKHDHAA